MPAKAVDGDVDGDLAEGHTAATNSHANSWWQVDLQSVQAISSITVWGRTDCCPEMTSDFHVFVSDNAFTSTDLNTTLNQAGVSNYYHSGFSGPTSSTGPTSLNVNRTGRYVRVQLAGTNSLALGEVQVWSEAAKLEWLVTDHLGTPRLAVDKTGTLGGVSRHDYLPFGEELFDGTGGRTTTQRYSVADGVRQKFTQKERDIETGLDYFGARYYASTQGRFSSADFPFVDQIESSPQSWNLYEYAANNPLRFMDPDGLGHRNAKGEYVGDYDGEYHSELQAIWHDKGQYWNFDEGRQRARDSASFEEEISWQRNGEKYSKFSLSAVAWRAANPGKVRLNIPPAHGDTLILFGPITSLRALPPGPEPPLQLGTARINLLQNAQNPQLRNMIDYLYRVGARIGNGSTADVIRFERETGELLSPAGHTIKGEGAIRNLEGLVRSGKLSPGDRQIAEQLINDLKDALK